MRTVIDAIDLFCGAGGLTYGLERAGISVKVGYDIDQDCLYAYEANNSAKFILEDICKISGYDLNHHWKTDIRLLAGCAPCQPFSTYTIGKNKEKDEKWKLLYEFVRLIEDTKPELVTMENVPSLGKEKIFRDFIQSLERLNYHLWYNIVNCADYGVPQNRKRLVLLASRLAPITLIPATHTKPVTVKEAIGHLEPLQAGERANNDFLHTASKLSEINLMRIKNSRPGGTWRDWPSHLIVDCHKKDSGRRYGSVYGRMKWDEPAPTMTTICYGYGNGRFGHPEQNRAITLREASIFQTFPPNYKFISSEKAFSFDKIGKLIGNAVPVRLGEVVGISIIEHLKQHNNESL